VSAWNAIAELYKHAVAEGALTGNPTRDAETIAATIPEEQRDVEKALRLFSVIEEARREEGGPT
jgi:hypothetical protein